MIRTAVVVALLGAFGLVASEQVRDAAANEEQSQGGEEESSEQLKEFALEIRQELDRLDDRIWELGRQSHEASGDARDRIERELDAATEARDDVRDQLFELEEQGGDALDDARGDIEEGLSRARDRVDSAEQRIERELRELGEEAESP